MQFSYSNSTQAASLDSCILTLMFHSGLLYMHRFRNYTVDRSHLSRCYRTKGVFHAYVKSIQDPPSLSAFFFLLIMDSLICPAGEALGFFMLLAYA